MQDPYDPLGLPELHDLGETSRGELLLEASYRAMAAQDKAERDAAFWRRRYRSLANASLFVTVALAIAGSVGWGLLLWN